MFKFLGSRGASAVLGMVLFAVGSSAAQAQVAPVDFNLKSTVGTASSMMQKAVATTTAVALGNGSVMQARPATSVTVTMPSNIVAEAAWLQKGGWPLYALVDRFAAGSELDEQSKCIAVAVYHEARGESVEGQLAVARVIMNRAASGKYPPDWCSVVKQPWQFSFVNPHTGALPSVDENSNAWRRALGVTRLAVANAVPSLSNDVLWYHADYVAPSWGRRLNMVQKIGAHIFYRA